MQKRQPNSTRRLGVESDPFGSRDPSSWLRSPSCEQATTCVEWLARDQSKVERAWNQSNFGLISLATPHSLHPLLALLLHQTERGAELLRRLGISQKDSDLVCITTIHPKDERQGRKEGRKKGKREEERGRRRSTLQGDGEIRASRHERNTYLVHRGEGSRHGNAPAPVIRKRSAAFHKTLGGRKRDVRALERLTSKVGQTKRGFTVTSIPENGPYQRV